MTSCRPCVVLAFCLHQNQFRRYHIHRLPTPIRNKSLSSLYLRYRRWKNKEQQLLLSWYVNDPVYFVSFRQRFRVLVWMFGINKYLCNIGLNTIIEWLKYLRMLNNPFIYFALAFRIWANFRLIWNMSWYFSFTAEIAYSEYFFQLYERLI